MRLMRLIHETLMWLGEISNGDNPVLLKVDLALWVFL